MNKKFMYGLIAVFLLLSCSLPNSVSAPADGNGQESPGEENDGDGEISQPSSVVPAGGQLITYIDSPGIGKIAVQVSLPEQPRYPEGAGVVVEVNTFLTPRNGFYSSLDVPAIGLIHVTYLWPGISAPNGTHSEGEFDYGGPLSIQALRDVIQFSSGQTPDHQGFYLNELIAINPLYDNVGLYAFSHPGQAAVNVIALYGEDISKVKYFVGRENPTQDKLTAVEIGYFGDQNRPVVNPLYQYPGSYRPKGIDIDYSSIVWEPTFTESESNWTGRPYFDFNGNGVFDGGDHILGSRVPAADGKRLYSIDLVDALAENEGFGAGDWPEGLATLDEVRTIWAFQDSTQRYPELRTQLPELKVMLVFARMDHVQPLRDKPHIHQAYDGFQHGAGLWVRLNPDQEYVAWMNAGFASDYQENPANQEPANWLDAWEWGYANQPGSSQFVPLAAVAEMADRTQDGNWAEDLGETLNTH